MVDHGHRSFPSSEYSRKYSYVVKSYNWPSISWSDWECITIEHKIRSPTSSFAQCTSLICLILCIRCGGGKLTFTFYFFQGSGEVSMRLPEGRGGAVGVRGAEEEEVWNGDCEWRGRRRRRGHRKLRNEQEWGGDPSAQAWGGESSDGAGNGKEEKDHRKFAKLGYSGGDVNYFYT